MYGDVPEVIRRSKLQTVLPENVEDKSVVCLRQVRRRHQAGFSLGQAGLAHEGLLMESVRLVDRAGDDKHQAADHRNYDERASG